MRRWLQTLVEKYLKQVQPLTDSPEDRAHAEALADQMRQDWAKHGMTSLPQQKNLMNEVRRYLKDHLGEDHIALATLNFSTTEWTEANRPTVQAIVAQNEQQVILSPRTVNAIVYRATQLLNQRSWADIATGLVVLTGRRSTEILKTAQFTLKTPYSVIFTGALKRQGEVKQLSFEIPTLCQAKYVIDAWKTLRQILSTEELSLGQVNNRYADDVCQACDRHFGDIVQPVQDKDNLYTHLFRKIYATIATYFYCPPNVDEAEFRAEIQGHFSGREDLPLAERRTIASDRHYRGYVIQDEQGNMRKGVHLDWQGVQVLEAFQSASRTASDSFPSEPEDEPQETLTMPRQKSQKRPAKALPDTASPPPTVPSPAIPTPPMTTPAPSVAPTEWTIVANQAHTLAWLTHELEHLRARVQELEQERERFKTPAPALPDPPNHAELEQLRAQVEQLQDQNQQLQQERDQAVAKLNAFRALLLNGAETQTPDQPTVEESHPEIETVDSEPPPSESRSVSGNSSPPPASRSMSGNSSPALSTQPIVSDDRLDPIVLHVLQAIFDHNNAQTQHHDKWAVSFNMMKALCKPFSVSSQAKIDKVLKGKAKEIEQHHRQHHLGERHNRFHQGQDVTEFIQVPPLPEDELA